jgi:F-type H+-transporting ATPase subunit b
VSRRRLLLGAAFLGVALSATALALGQPHDRPERPRRDVARMPADEMPPEIEGHPHVGPAAAEEEHASHDAHAAGGHHAPLAINWTDISDHHRPAYVALLINFGLLVGLYYTLGKKPIAEALKQRRVTIGKDIEEAQKILAEAKERAKKYQADLKNADADAATAKTALVAAGKGEVERLLLDAREKAERMKRDAERLIEQERKQVHQDILIETIELAVTEAGKVLERSATADDHARLAQDLLAELARRPAARPASPSSGGAA